MKYLVISFFLFLIPLREAHKETMPLGAPEEGFLHDQIYINYYDIKGHSYVMISVNGSIAMSHAGHCKSEH